MNSGNRLSWVLWLVVFGFGSNTVFAQSWADQLFDTRSHDFGYVARGSKNPWRFTITNTTRSRLHIAGATPSCSVCTIAKIEKDWLEPGESTVLEASINTLNVIGNKDVSITVAFDQPSYAQARLQLKCFSRSDIVLNPGEFSLGTVKRGTEATRTMNIEYAGSNSWKIASVTCSNTAISPELEETHRGEGRVGYRLKVTLQSDATPGMIRERIILGVNDAFSKSGIEVAFQCNVQADVSLSPAALNIGNIPAGTPMSKQVLVRGIKPFKILSIDGGDEGPFQIDRPEDSKQLHVLTVTLTPGHEPGEVSQDFKITTDMESEAPLKLSVSANLLGEKPIPKPSAN